MRKHAAIVVAALAACSLGFLGTASAASSSSTAGTRLVRSAEGGNGAVTYNYVRTADTIGARRSARPFALAGQSDRPTHYKAVGNVGGNGRTINLVPQWDGPAR